MRRFFVVFIVAGAVLIGVWRFFGGEFVVSGLFAADLFVAQIDAKPAPLGIANNDDKNKDKDKDKDNAKDKEINPYFTQLVTPDRSIERQIEQMERLIKVDRHLDVVRIIGELFEKSDSILIPPPPQTQNNGENNNGTETNQDERTTNTTFNKRLLEIFKNLPDKAKEAYNLQYKIQADSLLENAIKQGSFETLQKVAQKYLLTDAGMTALFLVGMYQLEIGDWESALLTFYKVNYVAEQVNFECESFEPLLSLSIAACQIRLDREAEALQTLEQFLKKFPRPKILTGGKEVLNPTNANELFAHVKESISSRDPNAVMTWLEHAGWLLPRGLPSQNPETDASSPLLETVWEVPNFNQDVIISLAKRLSSHVQSANETYIHALQPLIVGNFIITRGVDDVVAVDIDTGKRVWHQDDSDYQVPPLMRQILQNSGTTNALMYLNLGQGTLRTRIWHDRIANSMSSDGEYLFYIEEHTQRVASRTRNLPPLIVNNKAVENPLAKRSNTLAARDAKTGNLIWKVGKFNFVQKTFNKLATEIEADSKKQINPNVLQPFQRGGTLELMKGGLQDNAQKDNAQNDTNDKADGKKNDKEKDGEKEVVSLFSNEELLLSETLFLGAPLPLHGRLYCICESEGMLQLLVLNAGDGKLLSKVPLAQSSSQSDKERLRYLYGLTPSASNGIIFCPTGLGMVFAVDATTISPLWCFSYEPTVTQNPPDPQQRQFRFVGIDANSVNNEYYRQFFAQSGWQIPSVMIDGSRVLIAPPDLPMLYCVDLLTGKLLWQKSNLSRKNALYVACIHNKIAYVVTPVSLLALAMDSGRQVWEQVLVSQTTEAIFQRPLDNVAVPININVIAPMSARSIQPPTTDRPSQPSPDNNKTESNAENSTTKLSKLVFPLQLKPVGVGVHNGDLYYIPLSDGYIGVINLTECSIKLVSSPESVLRPEKQTNNSNENPTPTSLSGKGFNIPFGNLIALRGKFFSQSPFKLTCFEQWLDLNKRTEDSFKKNPNDAQVLLQLGKIRRLENNMSEAIDLFRKSMKNNPSEVVMYYLRQALMSAIKDDFKSWKHFLPELESLTLTPDERGEILFVKAQGEAKDGNVDGFIAAISKIFNTESEFHTNITPDSTTFITQLHNLAAVLLDQIKRNHNNTQLSQKIDQTAKEIFDNIRNNNFPTSQDTSVELDKHIAFQNDVQAVFANNLSSVLPEVRRWRTFIELFRTLPIAEEAKELLREVYKKDDFYLAAEMLLNCPVAQSIGETESGNVDTPEVKNLPKLSEVQLLASQLESFGAISDSHYYYNLISELYGEEGKEVAKNALQRPVFENYKKQNSKSEEWAKGNMDVQIEGIDNQPQRNRTQRLNANIPVAANTNAHAILQIARGNYNSDIRPMPVNFLGKNEPFLSQYRYFIELHSGSLALVAYDRFGKECWQFDLREYFFETAIYRTANYITTNTNGELRSSVITRMVKGCDHLLVLANGSTVIAIDTFGCGNGSNLKPRFLWSKQLPNDYQFTEKRLSQETNPTVYMQSNNIGGITQTMSMCLDVMLHVSKNVICYRENDKIYGIDPITGNTIWTRDVRTDACSIFGDRDSVFLYYPATRRVVAIEPFSGTEIKQGILAGNVLTNYGTSVVIDKIVLSGRQIETLVVDLNDMFLDDTEIKLCRDIKDVVQNELFTIEKGQIPVRAILPPTIQSSKYSKPLADERYFAVFAPENFRTTHKTQKRIFIYDLQNKSYAMGKTENDGTCAGVDLSRVLKNRNETNFQVYKTDDEKFIVLFNVNSETNRQNTNITDDAGEQYGRNIMPLSVADYAQNMRTEIYMLFDKAGNQCWKNTVNGHEWFLLQGSMQSNVPVFLYAANIRDQGITGKGIKTYIGIAAIDKTTGRKMPQKIVPYTNRTGNMLMTRLDVDDKKQEIKIHVNNAGQIITINFNNKNPEENKEKQKEKIEEAP
ncbi:MAG: PQQ-binding-like beta-propeller repeat protein [Planctomycetaceae bacterium]|nr:PQQ-binding-like beta-propeller repeat protein [Planctomycetaceae bacterium]